MNLTDLSGRTIMITGASSGIGKASAVYAAEMGASVILCGRNCTKLEETKKSMKNSEKHIIIEFDITDFEKYNDVFNQIINTSGKLNGLIHCAGIAEATPLRALTVSKINEIINTNFISFAMLVSYYSRKKYSDGGCILGVSAVNAHYPQKYMSIYAASKSAIESAVKAMAIELQEKNIRINCIAPGAVATPMAENLSPDILDSITDRHLLGLTTPEDIAKVVMFMISDASSSITGRTIYADGGRLGQ